MRVDIQDRIDEIDDELRACEEEMQELQANAREEFEQLKRQAENVETNDEFFEILEEAFELRTDRERQNELDQRDQELRKERQKLSDAADDWNGTEFEISELTYGDVMRISDEVTEASQQVGGAQRNGFYKIKAVEASLESTPDGCPNDPRDLPVRVGQWLYDEVNQLSSGGDFENLSDRVRTN